jgi:CO/xanthine dehydrogenase FAD-binding subunit
VKELLMLYQFDYLSPSTKEELFTLLRERGTDCRVLAGGTDLLVDVRAGRAAPRALVDVKKIREFAVLAYNDQEGLSIGAAVRCSDLLAQDRVREKYPLLCEAAEQIGSPQVRNRATIVGNICTASPSADMAPPLLCLGASVVISSHVGSRVMALKDFFAGVKKTALKADEMVERILVPPDMANARGGFEKLKRIKGHDLALVNCALIVKGELMRVAIGACCTTPVILGDFPVKTAADEVCKEAEESIKPIDDVRASKDYRVFMVRTFIKRLMGRIG